MLTLALIVTTLGVTPTFTHTGANSLVTPAHSVRTPKVVYVMGNITESSARSFRNDMLAAKDTGQPIIPVVISSYGGSIYALFEMVDVITEIGLPVATIVIGKAMSAGVVLASCGTNGLRFAAPSATFMIHEASSWAKGKAVEMEAGVAEIERVNTKLIRLMAKNSGKPPGYFADIIHKEGHANWYLTSEEAKGHGLINHIGMPEIKVSVDVTMKVE